MLSWVAFIALSPTGQKKHHVPNPKQKQAAAAKASTAPTVVNDGFDLGGNPFGLGLSRDALFAALGQKEPASSTDRYWMFQDDRQGMAYYIFDPAQKAVAFYWETRSPFLPTDDGFTYTNPTFVAEDRLLPAKLGTTLLVGLNNDDVLDWWNRFDAGSRADNVSAAGFPPYNRLRGVIALRLKPEYADPLNGGKQARYDQPYVLILEGYLPGANWFVSQHTFDPSKGTSGDWARLRTPQEQRDGRQNRFSFAVTRMAALPWSAYQQFAQGGKDPDIAWPNLGVSGNVRALTRPSALTISFSSTENGQIAGWKGSGPARLHMRGG